MNQATVQNDGPDFSRLIRTLRHHWKKFLLIWIGIVLSAFLFVLNQKPEFVSSGTLYISDPRGPGGDSSQFGSLSDLLPEIGSSVDIESQRELLKGTDLAIGVIARLGLNTELEGESRYLAKRPSFWQWRQAQRDPGLYDQGLKVTESYTNSGVYAPLVYRIRFNDSESFTLLDQEGAATSYQLGQPVRTEAASFVVSYAGRDKMMEGAEFKIKISPPELGVGVFLGSVSVKRGGKGTRRNNLIHVSFKSDSPYTAQSVVETLIQGFITLNQTWATSISRATLNFVNHQEEEIRAQLDQAISALTQFQTKSGLVSLEPQVEADLTRLINYEVKLRNEQLRLFGLERLVESLNKGNPGQFILTYDGNPIVQNMGVRLAEISTQIAVLQSQFQEDYPQLRQLKVERETLLTDLKSTLQNDLKRTRISEGQLAKTVEEYKGKFESLPKESKSLTDYLRSTKVYEELSLFLLQEKQKAKIAEASTLSSVRVSDQARFPLRETSPKIVPTMKFTAVFGLFFAAAAVLIPAMRVRWFTSVEEIKNRFSQPVFASVACRKVIPERASPAVLEQHPQSRYTESIRLLRTNLLHAMAGKQQQTILVTSSLPQDGKTSILSNLGTILIKSERIERVLLIDADLHRPSLHGIFGLLPSPGLSDYLNGQAAMIDIIHPVTLSDGTQIDVVCSGPVPPTPVELIETKAMQDLLDYARSRYTFTLIDSSPYPLITSAAILAEKVDRVLVVMRLGHTDRKIFNQHLDDLARINRNLGLVVATSEEGRGGYGYGYGYDDNYQYDYGYGNGNGEVNGAGRHSKSILRQFKRKAGISSKD